MKSHWNLMARCFCLIIVAVMMLGGTFCSPGVAWAGAPEARLPAPAPQSGSAPDVDAGPDQAADEGDVIPFSGVITDPDTPTGHITLWDFGDGVTVGDTLTPTHTYGDDGVYTVTLTVTDTTGLTGTDSLLVTTSNVPPVVDAGDDDTIAEGDTFSGSGSFTDPGADTWTA